MRESENIVKKKLESIGWKVKQVSRWGRNCEIGLPDLEIFKRGKKYLIEVKTPACKHAKKSIISGHNNYDFIIVVAGKDFYIIPKKIINQKIYRIKFIKYKKCLNNFKLLEK